MTFSEIWAIVRTLPCEPAPPGFRWIQDTWDCGPCYIAWRFLTSTTVDQSDGKVIGALCTLSIGALELPKEQRDDLARRQQEMTCLRAVDLCVERGMAHV